LVLRGFRAKFHPDFTQEAGFSQSGDGLGRPSPEAGCKPNPTKSPSYHRVMLPKDRSEYH